MSKLLPYKKFFEEVTIKGNQGIPGEAGDRSQNYLSNAETRGKQDAQVTGRENPHQLGPEIMNLLNQSQRICNGKEKDLEELAKNIILLEYGSILDGVELDIKIVRPGNVPMDDSEDGDQEQPPPMRNTNDPELRKEVDKAKILNNIIQGEAKNTKRILHSETSKDGINSIFGERVGNQIFDIWDRITKIADKLDWIIPIDIKGDMIENHPEGLAGSVKVSWKPKDKKEESSEDLANKILKSLEEGDDLKDNEEEISELFDESQPMIRARGVDFPMLLHEIVKGIYELIAAHSIPDNEELASKVKMNVTSGEDEAEDFRYGPILASDLRDFVNTVISEKSKTNRDILKYSNLREHTFGKMVDRNYLKTESFLSLFKGILNKTDEAKQIISKILDEILEELSGFDEKETSTNIDDIIQTSANQKVETTEKKMSKRELQQLIDQALDKSDFKEVGRLSDILTKEYPEK